MPCLPGPGRAEPVDVWRTAPTLLQQVRRCHLEICGGRRAKRALFGQPDREETRRFVKEELAAIRAADQQKYNFDFSNMRPLAGPYEWQPVRAGEVSAAYQLGRLQSGLQHRSARRIDFDAPRSSPPPEASRCSVSSQHEPGPSWPLGANLPRAETAPVAAAQQRRPTAASTTSSTPPLPGSPMRRASLPRRSAASRQTLITDFLRSRKRPSSFTSCGDAAAKRPSMLSPSSSTAAASGTSQRPTPAPVSGADTNA